MLSKSTPVRPPLMLGLKTLSNPSIFGNRIPQRCFPTQIHLDRLSIPTQSHNLRRFSVYAAEQRNGNGNSNGNSISEGNRNGNGNSNGNGISEGNRNGNGKSNGGGGGNDEDLKREKERPGLNLNMRWGQLLLDPDPDNVLAVGLTGLLTWASVQVVWQLVVVSLAIVVAGLKYSIVAALLIFILIALL